MIPPDRDGTDDTYAVVARASSPRGDVSLARRGARYELRVNGVYVMDTVNTATEEALADLALTAVADPRRVLVGGLGLGFTVRALLRDRRVEHLVVAELEPALVGWLSNRMIPGVDLTADPRLRVVVADVRDVVRDERPATLDAIVLDVDNGPGNLVHAANADLYERDFLVACADRLRPGGAVAVWSSTSSPTLAALLSESVGECVTRRLQVRLGARDDEYVVYLATRRRTEPR